MKVLTLNEAADFLKLHPVTLRAMAAKGEIPCAKIRREWRFIDEHLLDYLSKGYTQPRQERQVPTMELEKWEYLGGKAKPSGKLKLPRQTEQEYKRLLGLQ